MDETLTLRFTPQKKDYIRASRALAARTPGFWVIGGVILLVMVASGAVLLIPSLGQPSWKNIALIALLVGAFYVIYYFVFIPLQLGKAFKDNAYLQKERQLVFSEEGVMMQVGDKSSRLVWENFNRVMDAGDSYLLIYEGTDKIYPFIPARAFDSGELKEAFCKMLEEKGIPLA